MEKNSCIYRINRIPARCGNESTHFFGFEHTVVQYPEEGLVPLPDGESADVGRVHVSHLAELNSNLG